MFSSLGPLLAAALLAAAAEELAPDDPSLPRCEHKRCLYIGPDYSRYNSHYYKVEDKRVIIDQFRNLANRHLNLNISCNGASVLESPALPRVAKPDSCLQRLTLTGCPLPANSSLADTLVTLNLKFCLLNPDKYTGFQNELFITELPAAPPFSSNLFAGLEAVQFLNISTTSANCDPDFLAPLQSLVKLTLKNVTVSTNDLNKLPTSLKELKLVNAGVAQLPEAIYSSSSLTELIIWTDNSLEAGTVPSKLEKLVLHSSATALRLDAASALTDLELTNWVELWPLVLTNCSNLKILHLTAPAMHALPVGWLANCSKLSELVIEDARNLTALPSMLYNYHIYLGRLALRQGVLESLGPDFSTFNTWQLELDGNHLRSLERVNITASIMNVSSNDLHGGDVLNNVWGSGLIELDLSHNPHISDFCDANGSSPIHEARDLQKFVLRGTGVTRICRDWREKMTSLEELDLSNTQVTELSFEDLQFTRTVKTDVWLLGTPVTVVKMTREEMNSSWHVLTSYTSVHLDAALKCDCRMHWTRRALGSSPNVLDRVSNLSCTGGGLLRDMPLEDMVCERVKECEAAALPEPCTCASWAEDDPDHDSRLVRVRCENASLNRVLHLPTSTTVLYELRLAYNNISALHADDLQHNIKGLDLRNNSIKSVDDETAKKLGNVSGLLRLAGNPLECDCSAAPLLRALHSRARVDTDLETMKCHNGSELYKIFNEDCPQLTPFDMSLVAWLTAAVLTLVVAVVVFLASRERRFFVLAVLHRWGCVWRAAEPAEEEGRRYDAFVTFSHKDEAVVRELVARLEPPYRLCVHERDWVPGGYIGEQVTRSVRESRRTLALVSRHYLASSWARAEFREAHAAAMLDARPRLLVVLLQEPHTLRVDAQLRTYLRTNTYLRWGEPWFWDKLKLALPPPRSAPPPSPKLPSRLALPSAVEPAVELVPMLPTADSES